MPNQFSEEMSKRTHAELIRILKEQRNDYEPEAIAAAEEEYKSRNLSVTEVAIAESELQTQKNVAEAIANEPLGGEWKILTALFPGIIQIIYSRTFIAEGYNRKARELVQWTLYGFIFYVSLILVLMVILN